MTYVLVCAGSTERGGGREGEREGGERRGERGEGGEGREGEGGGRREGGRERHQATYMYMYIHMYTSIPSMPLVATFPNIRTPH